MKFTTFIPAAAVVAALGISPALAQQTPAPAPSEQQPAPAPAPGADKQAQAMSVQGELRRVDAETRMLWVQADGKEQQFRFSDDTEITGAGRDVEGLSTMTGTNVTVHYKVEGAANVATKIDIQARGSAPQGDAPRDGQPAPAPAPQGDAPRSGQPAPAPAPQPQQ